MAENFTTADVAAQLRAAAKLLDAAGQRHPLFDDDTLVAGAVALINTASLALADIADPR